MSRRNKPMSQTIYDKDATLVIQNNTVEDGAYISDSISVFKSESNVNSGKKVPVEDILDTMAGYIMPNFRFVSTGEKGECMICGQETSISARKLCGNCMNDSGERLYLLAKKAIKNGEKEVTI